MKIIISLLIAGLFLLEGAFADVHDCPPSCDQNTCEPPIDCLAGMVKDKCNCCYVCGQKEGERCYDPDLIGLSARFKRYANCGENLVCRLRTDLPSADAREAICYCSNEEPMCGSDGVTYDTLCQLTEARYKKRDGLMAVRRGPCKSAPKVVTSPDDITVKNGTDVAFSCEVIGWPVPTIEWRVIREINGNQMPDQMPSDDPHIVVLSRGGPNNYEVTGWLQLLSVRPSDRGTYICVAINEEGESRASAKLTLTDVPTSVVVENNQDDSDNEI